ncbi:unnamed protein product [Cylindrotheca closterium]|uniref:enoyl-[acyl-carrier-protein] reductase n=1 Tax=Cylindrotheca closterium TaxID=2856 RepID=A0AAD2CIM3_9STRA|nr:unnamed protein product [Cylindrotheca closterium]
MRPALCKERRWYHELSYASHGEPTDVLSFQTTSDDVNHDPTDENLVHVKMIHSPWNPADINTVQGTYPSPAKSLGIKDNLSAESLYFSDRWVAGSEGWGRITSDSKNLRKGSLVAIGTPGLGTLRSSLWIPESSLLVLSEEILGISGPAGCSLIQLGGTAFRMLSDFAPLQPGDVVVQNAGNSAVGLMASQIAASKGISMASVVRRGSRSQDEYDELVEYLLSKGKNSLVIAEEDLDDKESLRRFQAELKQISVSNELPKLALNAVGGASVKALIRSLENGGTLVTYGGMSAQPVVLGTPQLIFKDIRAVGYWHSRWMIQQSHEQKQEMVNILSKAVLDKSIECPPVKVFPLKNVEEALHWQSSQGSIRKKLIWDCQEI